MLEICDSEPVCRTAAWCRSGLSVKRKYAMIGVVYIVCRFSVLLYEPWARKCLERQFATFVTTSTVHGFPAASEPVGTFCSFPATVMTCQSDII